MGNLNQLAEKDLFEPIKQFFESEGFVCDGEVASMDIFMQREGETAAVELKKTLDFKAVTQGALRQKLVDRVYIGIYRPRDINSHGFKDKIYLLKRLGIGLLVVSPRSMKVELVSDAIESSLENFKRVNKRRKEAALDEFNRRKTHLNTGGVTRTKLITSYREDSLLVLDALCALKGEAKASEVSKLSNIENAGNIMYKNYYGWFERKGNGIYAITDSGFDALEEYEEVLRKMNGR